MSVVVLAVVMCALVAFGYLFARRILLVADSVSCIAFAATFGLSVYACLLNAVAYALPIHTAITISAFTLIVCTAAMLFVPVYEKVTYPHRLWCTVLIFVAVIAGIATARGPGSDSLSLIHYPVPATILEGNFPIYDVVLPWLPFGYHYAAMLLAAAFSYIGSISFSVSYALQPLSHAVGIVFFGAALGFMLTRSWKKATLLSLLLLFGSGLAWLNGFSLLADLWQVYIRGIPLEGGQVPLRWLSPTFFSGRGSLLIGFLHHRSVSLGIASTFGCLYCLIQSQQGVRTAWWIIAAVFYSAVVALSLETTFVLLIAAVLVYAVFLRVPRVRSWYPNIHTTSLWWFIVLASLFAAVQGGVITTTLFTGGDTDVSTFSFHLLPYYKYGDQASELLYVLSKDFFYYYGATLLALPVFLGVLFWKPRAWSPSSWLLIAFAFAHLIVPFFVVYEPRPNELDRIIVMAVSFGAMFLGVLAFRLHERIRSRLSAIVLYIVIAATCGSALIGTVVRLLFPTMELGYHHLMHPMPAISDREQQIYDYVTEHSTTKDWFFSPRKQSDIGVHIRDRVLFITYTGRFSVGKGFHSNPIASKHAYIDALQERCDAMALRLLNIRYIALLNEEHDKWFASRCLRSNFTERMAGSVYEFTP